MRTLDVAIAEVNRLRDERVISPDTAAELIRRYLSIHEIMKAISKLLPSVSSTVSATAVRT